MSPVPEPPTEAPQVEELPEPVLARLEEVVNDINEDDDAEDEDPEQLPGSAAVAASFVKAEAASAALVSSNCSPTCVVDHK